MPRVDAYLVAGGKYHDINFARLELLKLMHADDDLRVCVAENYHDIEAIKAADFLISYTCDVRPTAEEEVVLNDFVASGKRLFALHATNSIIEFTAEGVDCPRLCGTLMETLGSQFISHPEIEPYEVEIVQPEHPLVAGIEPFSTTDELYCSELHGELNVLMQTFYNGTGGGFVENDWQNDDPRPVMYLHPVGEGEVLYLTLGHARSKYDMQPVMDEYPMVERGSWEVPAYYELLRRGINWAKEPTLKSKS